MAKPDRDVIIFPGVGLAMIAAVAFGVDSCIDSSAKAKKMLLDSVCVDEHSQNVMEEMVGFQLGGYHLQRLKKANIKIQFVDNEFPEGQIKFNRIDGGGYIVEIEETADQDYEYGALKYIPEYLKENDPDDGVVKFVDFYAFFNRKVKFENHPEHNH